MQSTEGPFQVYGVGAVAAISDIIAIHKIFAFCLGSLVSSLYPLHFFLSQSLWEGPECEGHHPLLSRSDRDAQALRELAVLSGSTNPSCSVFRGDLMPALILRDSIRSNQVGSNSVEHTIDNCNGTKRVQS